MLTIFVLSSMFAILSWCLARSRFAAALSFLGVFIFFYIKAPSLILRHDFTQTWLLFFLALFWTLLWSGIASVLRKKPRKIPVGAYVLPVCLAVVVALLIPVISAGSHLFAAKSYRATLAEPVSGNFESDVEQIDQSQVRVVDQALAARRAEELLGAEAGLGSRVAIGEMTIQSVKGELTWVAPLVHNGFFKWLNNWTTPGYVRVAASNIREAEIVLDHEIRYGPEGFFLGRNLLRYAWMKGDQTHGKGDYRLELDDDGKPWWVIPLYRHTVAFSGAAVKKLLLVDPTTGEARKYDLSDVPEWVDRVQPEEIIHTQINRWGTYVHGFWNSILAKRDVVMATPGMSLVYSSDGRAMWYTGIRSAGQDQGTQGFMLVDSRTGKPIYYRKAGVTETGAREAIEGRVANFQGYSATNPILYNVDGQPVFIASIKDMNGNLKMIGAVSAQDRSVVAVGDTVRDALSNLSRSFAAHGYAGTVATGGEAQDWTGKVARIGHEVVDGETRWFLTLESDPDHIFAVPASLPVPVMPLLRSGDNVVIEAVDNGQKVLSAQNVRAVAPPPAELVEVVEEEEELPEE